MVSIRVKLNRKYRDQNLNGILRNACKRGIDKLDKWFPKFDSKDWKPIYQNIFFGVILDPRFKNRTLESWGLTFAESNVVIQAFRDLHHRRKWQYDESENRDTQSTEIDDSTQTTNDNSLYNISDDEDDQLIFSGGNRPSSITIQIDEIDKYFEESLADRKTKPLEYWKSRYRDFPVLSRLARIYLAIPATSGPSESIFSIGGDIITKKRNRLSPEMFRWIMLLKSWGVISDIEDLVDDNNE